MGAFNQPNDNYDDMSDEQLQRTIDTNTKLLAIASTLNNSEVEMIVGHIREQERELTLREEQ